jgi:hypothetical protein
MEIETQAPSSSSKWQIETLGLGCARACAMRKTQDVATTIAVFMLLTPPYSRLQYQHLAGRRTQETSTDHRRIFMRFWKGFFGQGSWGLGGSLPQILAA